MSYVNGGITWTHPTLGARYSGKVGIRCSVCGHEDDVEQTYGHCASMAGAAAWRSRTSRC